MSLPAAAEVGPGGEDAVLATKLHVPRPHEAFVPRPRLVELLDAGSPGRIAVVCAPAGFGKSALLADWARRRPTPVAWLSLDEADNDPARFWRHVIAALDRAHPGTAARLGPLLGPPAPSSFTGLVTALVNQLAESEPPPAGTALILDDFHVIESAQVVDSFAYLVEHRPAALGLLVGSRMDPPLPLARLRVRGELTEVRAEQLRFTAEESAALLRGALGTDLPAGDVAALTARTEGWAAGLQLAGLSLRGETDPARFVANFSGSHRFVLDYLTEEVIARQPAQVTEFLLQTSPLDQLSGPLCDAVTGRSDGQQMLERLERDNLFLVPLDDVRGWWRYHHLFADLLRARLLHQYPDRVAHLHAAASDWYEEHGHAEAAVQHAFAARASDRAAELIERHADRMLLRSEGMTIQRWLSALPAATVSTRPRLLLVQARLALLSGRTEEAESALAAAEQVVAAQARAAGPAGPVDDYQPSVAPGASLLVDHRAGPGLPRRVARRRRGGGRVRGQGPVVHSGA